MVAKPTKLASPPKRRGLALPIKTWTRLSRLEIRMRYSGTSAIPLTSLRTVTSQFVISAVWPIAPSDRLSIVKLTTEPVFTMAHY